MPIVTLRPGKDISIQLGHPWIFSGALQPVSKEMAHGSVVSVCSSDGQHLGVGTYAAHSSIAVRLFDRNDVTLDRHWFADRLREADARRRLNGFAPGTGTTGYRVAFGESDNIPGLVVDRYSDVLVMQCGTAGLDRLREEILAALLEVFQPRAIVERSDLTSRHDELIEQVVAVRFGADPGPVEFLEHSLRFIADPLKGQKTGFFLDQKDLRLAIGRLANGMRVLNLFSYSGSASISAIMGGATSVLNVDSSAPALELCHRQARLNGIDEGRLSVEAADVFAWLGAHDQPEFDMVILDPPALIKTAKDLFSGRKAYHFLNRAALRLVRDRGLLVTSSCSQHFKREDLLITLRRASQQAGVQLHTLASLGQSADHPVSIYFPESEYLKSYICQVRRSS